MDLTTSLQTSLSTTTTLTTLTLPSSLITLLEELTSQHPDIVKSAEKKLRLDEVLPGFHAALQNVVLLTDLPYPIRWMASRCLKDGVERFWRKSSKCCLTLEEKNQIRSNALLMLNELNHPILIQISLMLGRMARTDFPTEWPDLFDHLFQLLSNPLSDLKQKERTMFALHAIIKALTSQKIGVGRAHTEQISSPLLLALCPLFFQHFSQLQSHPLAFYTLKCIRKILVFGVKQVDRDAEPFLARLPEFFTFYFQQQQETYLHQLSKLVLDFQERHGTKWLVYPGMREVVHWHANAIVSKSSTIPSKILISSFTILKSAMKSASSYTPGEQSLERRKSNAYLDAQLAASEAIITPTVIHSLLEVILTWHLRVTKEHMDMMDSDPYECIIEEDKDHWEFTEKGCASRLLMEIVRDYPDVSMAYLTPVLQTFTHATSVQRYDEATLVSMVTGLAAIADQLHTLLPFIPFLTHFLIPWSMQSSSPWVHRVICECIKAFVTVNIPRSECHVIYDWLAKAMRFPHPMVQLAVVDALRCALDSWEFEVTLFLPYLEHFMGQLVPLFSIPAFELKMKVTHCMSVMFERIGSHMVPCTSFLLTVLPNLWLQAVKEQENMFQTSVLHLTLKWVESLQAECLQVQSLAAHFIDQACDVRSPSALYLMEDGLQLWHRMLWYATDPSTLLHQKRWLPSLLEQGSEHLKCVLKIVESYVLLDPLGYMTSVGANVMEVLACLLDVPSYQNAFPTQPSPIPTATTTTTTTTSSTMTITHPSPLNSSAPLSFSYSNLRPQASGAIIQTLELILVSFPEMALTWLLDYQIVRRILCGMLMKSDHPLTLVAFLTLLSRICLQVTHLESLFHSNSLTVDIHALVDVWLDLWDQLAHLHQRKLTVLSFTRLLPFMFHSTLMTSTSSRSPTTSPTTSTTVLPLLHRQAISMLTFCAEFLHEVHESPQGDAPIYWALRQDTLEYPDETVPEWLRRQQLLNSKDPVHGTVTLQAIQSALDQLANQLGGHEPLVAMLPKDLVQDLKTFM